MVRLILGLFIFAICFLLGFFATPELDNVEKKDFYRFLLSMFFAVAIMNILTFLGL